MTKKEIIEHLQELDHCFDPYWTQSDQLKIMNRKIFCARCNVILAEFNEITCSWDQV